MVRIAVLSTILIVLLYGVWLTFQIPSAHEAQSQPFTRVPASFNVTQIQVPGAESRQVPRYEESQGKYETRSIKHWMGARRYHVYVGRKADMSEPKPAVFLLHGSQRTGASMIDMWARVADQYGLVLIAPDSSSRKGWSGWFDPASFFENLIDDAATQYGLDRERLYLFGHSSGGVRATLLAQDGTLPFRAVATHAGFPSASKIDSGNGGRTPRPPICHFLGDKDHLFSVEAAKATSEALKDAGHDTLLMVVKNHTHWYYYVGPSINEKAWWFFERH